MGAFGPQLGAGRASDQLRQGPAKEHYIILRSLDAFERFTGRKAKGWLSSSLRGTLQTAGILFGDPFAGTLHAVGVDTVLLT